MNLKDILGQKVYAAQKKLFKSIIDGGKKELVKKADDIYILQKEVIADLQAKAVEAAKKEVVKFYNEKFDVLCGIIKAKVPYLGGIVASILLKYKKEILEVVI